MRGRCPQAGDVHQSENTTLMKAGKIYDLGVAVIVVALAVLLWPRSSDSPVAVQEKPKPVQASTPTPNHDGPPEAPPAGLSNLVLLPLEGRDAPPITEKHRVRFTTNQGDFVVEVYPQAAPNAVERFLKLVDVGYYNHTAVSRVVPDFVVQFGINAQMAEWKDNTFDDDPSLFQHQPGTVAFAKAGLNTNSTQVFINLEENNRLADPSYNFTVFGQVVEGMDNVVACRQVGEPVSR